MFYLSIFGCSVIHIYSGNDSGKAGELSIAERFTDTDSDDINRTTFLNITSDPRIKQRLALKMYDAVECNEIKTYLRRAGKSIAEWMILDKDEEALIQFLKKDIITANTIDKLIPQMDTAEMINAKAYALEYIRKSTKEKSFRI